MREDASGFNMKIQLLSDCHIELYPYQPEALPVDLVILAGDIHTKGRGVAWAAETLGAPVLYVLGNHEYYGGHLDKTLAQMRDEAAKTNGQVTVLERDSVVIGDVRFFAATAWTDFSIHDERLYSALDAERLMNDYKKIRATTRHRKLIPSDLIRQNEQTRDWLRRELPKPFPGKTVVITHHAPCPLSIPDWRRQCKDELNPAYANDWTGEAFWKPENVQLWLHGHIHQACDYEVNGVRVVCNPKGYRDRFGGESLVNNFNTWLVLDV